MRWRIVIAMIVATAATAAAATDVPDDRVRDLPHRRDHLVIDGASLYQWDSVKLYVDGAGDREWRMDEDDTQLILACDGRHGAMHGDELLRGVGKTTA